MKKIFFLCIIILFSVHVSFAMEYNKFVTNLTQTVYDKFDPRLILTELNNHGVSPDLREKMTQMHRLDRLIPHYIEQADMANLCAALQQIITNKFPLSSVGYEMAANYLLKQRPSISKDKPLLDTITSTLDLLDPAQVINDLQKNKLYSATEVDIENRVNLALDRLMLINDISNLEKLITVLTAEDKKTAIIPGNRILNKTYQYLRSNEKKAKSHKNIVVTIFGIKKNDSDTEELKKNDVEPQQ